MASGDSRDRAIQCQTPLLKIQPRNSAAGPFKPGQSGNPTGRPKGARNRATLAAEALLDGEAEALTRKAISMALEGRLLPPRKERAIQFSLPPLESAEDVQHAVGAILEGVAAGQITPSEATAIMSMVDAYRRTAGESGTSPAPVVQVQFTAPERHAIPLASEPSPAAPRLLASR